MLITAKAKSKIEEFLTSDLTNGGDASKVFRIAVTGGGCSGFKYLTEITESRDDDITVSERTVTDTISNGMLENVIVDYADTISQSGFIFSNPGASSTCGCGVSDRMASRTAIAYAATVFLPAAKNVTEAPDATPCPALA